MPPAPRTAAVEDLEPWSLGPRVLVVAPHPDDEVIACGGTIAQTVMAGAEVRVVLMTAGDGYRRAAARLAGRHPTHADYVALGEARHEESLSALGALGLPHDALYQLGYPDGSIDALWAGAPDGDTPVVGATGTPRSPYGFAHSPGVQYERASVSRDLEWILGEFAPTTVVYPDADDDHPDHRATAAFVEEASVASCPGARRLTYLVHRGLYPFPWAYLPRAALRPPPTLAAARSTWFRVPLSADAQSRKLAAVREHRTQTAIPDLTVFLLSFVRRNELFRGMPALADRAGERAV